MSDPKTLSYASLSPNVKNCKYAVRGPIVIKASEYQSRLRAGEKLPFSEVFLCNVGNPHQLGQPPLSYNRQVLACMMDKTLLTAGIYHKDVIERAKLHYSYIPSSGAYAESQGIRQVRENCAKFIEKRDGFPSNPNHIFITNGASDGIKNILLCLIAEHNHGILIPVPRYPLYSAEIILKGGQIVPYYLNEEKNWSLDLADLEEGYNTAKTKGVSTQAIVVINPGNPTGAILEKENIEQIIKFCYEKKIVIIADEVYQHNIYDPKVEFISFKKVLFGMGAPYKDNVQLVSFHSVSKGVHGECGLRGGYMELVNVEEPIISEMVKLQSIILSSSVVGQLALDLLVSPPSKDNCSPETIELYEKEYHNLHNSLKKRAKIVTEYFNKMTNASCKEVQGAMYAFPSLKFSQKVLEAAKLAGQLPDEFYCFQCLDETGIVLVPGSGFGQRDGTYHLRITTLVYPEDRMEYVMKLLFEFNEKFHKKYE